MAIDSREKRASALVMGRCCVIGMVPASPFIQGQRQMCVRIYSGILAAGPQIVDEIEIGIANFWLALERTGDVFRSSEIGDGNVRRSVEGEGEV